MSGILEIPLRNCYNELWPELDERSGRGAPR